MAQFDRIYKITLGVQGQNGVVIEGKPKSQGLNVEFEIYKDLTSQTNDCYLKIYNLSMATVRLIEKDDTICMLEVGYSEDIGLRRIFLGWVVGATTTTETDRITELKLADGQLPIRDSVVSLSYADKVSRKKIIDDVAKDMGLVVTYAEDVEFTELANGFSFVGAGRDCLTKACKGSDLAWSIQNNVLQIIKEGSSTKVEAIKLSADSGLIGSPVKLVKAANEVTDTSADNQTGARAKKAGWSIKCLLQPTLNPGDLVYIQSKQIEGWFKIETLKHSGSYAGDTWYTEMEVYEIKGEGDNK